MGCVDTICHKCSMGIGVLIMLALSCVFSVVAVLLIVCGVAIQMYMHSFLVFIDENLYTVPLGLIAIGFILLIVVLLSAYGAVNESVLLINLFGVALFLIFLLEVAASIAICFYHSQVNSMLARTMDSAMADYDQNLYIKDTFDSLQSKFECCGKYDMRDWDEYRKPDMNNKTVSAPASCCARFSRQEPTICVEFYTNGCLKRLDFMISDSLMQLSSAATIAATVQVLGIFAAFMLARAIRRNKTMRAVNRWHGYESVSTIPIDDRH